MSEALELALSFTAIDAASGLINRLEQRIAGLGKAGAQVQADFAGVQNGFRRTMEGAGLIWSGWKIMQPGVSAAMDMQDATLRTKSYLADGVKSAAALNAEMRKVSETSYKLSEKMPIPAADIATFQNSLLKQGFAPDMVMSTAETALSLGRLRGTSPESTEAMMELFRGQFGVDSADKMNAALDWTAKTGADPDEVFAALQKSGLAMHAHGVSLDSAITLAGLLKEAKLVRPGFQISAMMDNVFSSWGDTKSDPARWARRLDLSFFKGDKFIGFEAMQEQLKNRFKTVSESDRQLAFSHLFGSGDAVAEMLFKSKDLSGFKDESQLRAGAVDAVAEQFKSLSSEMTEFGNAMHNAMARLYIPSLPVAAKAVEWGKKGVSWVGDELEAHPKVATALELAGAGIAAYGIYRGAGGIAAMLKNVWNLKSSMKGAGLNFFNSSTMSGLAIGKAQETITGIKPVFVTNWPTAFGGQTVSGLEQYGNTTLPSTVGGAAGAGAVTGVGALLGMNIATAFATAPILASAGILIAAGTGVALGELANKAGAGELIDKLGFDKLGEAVANMSQSAHQYDGMTEHTKEQIINLHITADGRIIADTDSKNIKFTLERGNMHAGRER
jgi:TP901 family phage tail tape measure protein